jgi:hypothetical protein
MKSIEIPSRVCEFEGSAFALSPIESISVAPENQRFCVNECFLVDFLDSILVKYFGSGGNLVTWNEIKTLGKFCLAAQKIGTVAFESGSQLTRIEEFCFSRCSLDSICILCSVEVIGKSCFHSATALLEFESDSKIVRFEESCFGDLALQWICIP